MLIVESNGHQNYINNYILQTEDKTQPALYNPKCEQTRAELVVKQREDVPLQHRVEKVLSIL